MIWGQAAKNWGQLAKFGGGLAGKAFRGGYGTTAAGAAWGGAAGGAWGALSGDTSVLGGMAMGAGMGAGTGRYGVGPGMYAWRGSVGRMGPGGAKRLGTMGTADVFGSKFGRSAASAVRTDAGRAHRFGSTIASNIGNRVGSTLKGWTRGITPA